MTGVRIAFLPITPLLIPELATGATADLDDLRHAARMAADWAAAADGATAILVPDQPVGALPWSLDGFGRRIGTGSPVGLAEGIGRWLLGERPAEVLGVGADLTGYAGVLAMGDGSASRTERAPGHLHPGATAFDAALVAAVEQGDAGALADLDLGLAGEVAAAGATVWQHLGHLVPAVDEAHVDCVCDPYGVLYLVARWSARWADPA